MRCVMKPKIDPWTLVSSHDLDILLRSIYHITVDKKPVTQRFYLRPDVLIEYTIEYRGLYGKNLNIHAVAKINNVVEESFFISISSVFRLKEIIFQLVKLSGTAINIHDMQIRRSTDVED
jgi:hypothetical protein